MTIPRSPSEQDRREHNVAALRSYFRLLEERDIDTWITLWAENCTQRVPYATGNLPSELHGRSEIHTLYKSIASGFTKLRFTETELLPLHDPDMVFARWRPRAELVGGGVYVNESIGLFQFDQDGKIRHFDEYFNPAGFVENYDSFD